VREGLLNSIFSGDDGGFDFKFNRIENVCAFWSMLKVSISNSNGT
jgi:hypothetical protein